MAAEDHIRKTYGLRAEMVLAVQADGVSR